MVDDAFRSHSSSTRAVWLLRWRDSIPESNLGTFSDISSRIARRHQSRPMGSGGSKSWHSIWRVNVEMALMCKSVPGFNTDKIWKGNKKNILFSYKKIYFIPLPQCYRSRSNPRDFQVLKCLDLSIWWKIRLSIELWQALEGPNSECFHGDFSDHLRFECFYPHPNPDSFLTKPGKIK